MKYNILLIFIIFLNYNVPAQNRTDIIAKVGPAVITAEEFKLRYELSPFVSKNAWNEDSLKQDFLYSLIAEKLWSLEAEKMGYTSREEFSFYFQPLVDIYTRDALFKSEIESKVKVYENDLGSAISKSQVILNTEMISSYDSLSIFSLYQKLNPSSDFDSLLSLSNSTFIKKPVDIKFGTMQDEEIEDSLYRLNINQYTKPVKSEMGWVIFRIKNKTVTPVDLSDEKTVNEIKRIIRMRKTKVLYDNYLKELLSGIKITAEQKPFIAAAKEILKRFEIKTAVKNPDTSGVLYSLDDNDYRSIKSSLGDKNISAVLFRVHDKNVNVNEFLSSLAFREFSVENKDSVYILQKLNRYLKSFIEERIITYEAYRKKMNETPEVKSALDMWKGNYLAQMLRLEYLDSVSVNENEVYDYYINDVLRDTGIVLVNMKLVSVSDLDEVSSILDKIKSGLTFPDVIKSYGKTDPLADENGETGLKPLMLLGDIGQMAANLKLNEVYGPVHRGDKYTLMMITDRQQTSDTFKISYESSKGVLKDQLRLKKINEILSSKTAGFASENKIKVYDNTWNKIPTAQIKMFVHRLMGFGGRIAAVPVTDNWSEWIDIYKLKKEQLP